MFNGYIKGILALAAVSVPVAGAAAGDCGYVPSCYAETVYCQEFVVVAPEWEYCAASGCYYRPCFVTIPGVCVRRCYYAVYFPTFPRRVFYFDPVKRVYVPSLPTNRAGISPQGPDKVQIPPPPAAQPNKPANPPKNDVPPGGDTLGGFPPAPDRSGESAKPPLPIGS